MIEDIDAENSSQAKNSSNKKAFGQNDLNGARRRAKNMSTLQVLHSVKNQSRKSQFLNQQGSLGNGLLSTNADSFNLLERNSDFGSNLSGSISRLDDDNQGPKKKSPRGYQYYGKTQYNDLFNLDQSKGSVMTTSKKPPRPLKPFNVKEYMENKPKNKRETLRSSIQSYQI